MTESKTYPLLPLRGLLVYPSMVLHLDVGREKSVKALEEAMIDDSHVMLIAQKETSVDEPESDDLYEVGTVAFVKQMVKLPNGTHRVLVEGVERAKVKEIKEKEEHFETTVTALQEVQGDRNEEEALTRTLMEQFEQYVKISKKVTKETYDTLADIDDPSHLADMVASHLPIKIKEKQGVLETSEVKERLKRVIDIIGNEREVLQIEQKIGQRVKKSMENTQKEYYLREQMKAIQNELGDKDGKSGEVAELKEKIENANMPERIELVALKELGRYEKVPQSSAESSVIRNYIEWLVVLPWTTETEDNLDVPHAEEILEEDHYGLDKVKERILEYLAVQQLTQSIKGPILCLVGPPGVGKTSLAKSIARAINRKFVRISVGGIRDEAEVRGHRRTYIGAMPGRIIQGMKRAETVNPVFLLDEIDKMASDFRGDPSSAMLEVLDPEQNATFSDHYIEEDYDLSNVLFVATANTMSTIPGPLMDRMEVIQIAGYTEVEKLHIAKEHLLGKQITENGLTRNQLQFRDDALMKLIRRYTREAGVRGLEREIANVCRKAAKIIVSGEKKRVIVTEKMIEELIGRPKFRYGQAELEDQVGAATGLAYTAAGGDTLSIEVSVSPGKGNLTLTGKLGDVMKESAQAAFSYIRTRADELNISSDFVEKNDIHIHVPEGATPKDGPSAGITMATALVSALTGRAVSKEVGMTGEITLRGRVLPIGGLKQKALSAHRAGLTRIIIPFENKKDLDDIPESVRNDLTFIPVKHLDEVLEQALTGEKNESK
ncbi:MULTISPECIES: endopeptidase La [Salimicrobium]|uniref:Lon protease n=3 Tax=Salimicrobium TaxID=351195 RepID=K2GAS7_9BACI|nr:MULTISPECIES: endopeptidase La [Salimicrobium]AKG04198.1 endopeptidase La [Salimicrobium jeotgali]EKE32163.1 ATP-dependent protease La 1 [Salimicrobium jeotgali]MBM7695774.1 ATP-dependent Lon protease [Salimicrobium jeotgali]SDX63570.1 ATP-dependent Lon protease [Salimicrobium album]SIS50573.1 ATP-dependent Lon protease [Salimicrobium salexigens]